MGCKKLILKDNMLYVINGRGGFNPSLLPGAGEVLWGGISGLLSNQLDLQLALSAKLNLSGGDINGTAGNGFFGAIAQSVAPSTPSSGFRIFANSSNAFSWKGQNGFVRTFDGTSNTADRSYTLPNSSGTVALTSDLASYIPLSGTSALAGNIIPSSSGTRSLGSGSFRYLSIFSTTLFAQDFRAVNGSGINLKNSAGTLVGQFLDANGALILQNGGSFADNSSRLQVIGNVTILDVFATANAAAQLQVDSSSKGFLPPRMTTTQKNAISSPPSGLIVYDTTLGKLCVRGASAWETITST